MPTSAVNAICSTKISTFSMAYLVDTDGRVYPLWLCQREMNLIEDLTVERFLKDSLNGIQTKILNFKLNRPTFEENTST